MTLLYNPHTITCHRFPTDVKSYSCDDGYSCRTLSGLKRYLTRKHITSFELLNDANISLTRWHYAKRDGRWHYITAAMYDQEYRYVTVPKVKE